MKKTEIGYAAGIIDGEGSILLSRTHKEDPYRTPTVSVSSTTKEILKFFTDRWGGTIVEHKTYQDHHKRHYSWKLHYQKAISFLEVVFPLLKHPEKIRRSKMLIEEYTKLTPRNGKYSEQMRKNKLSFEKRFLHPSTS